MPWLLYGLAACSGAPDCDDKFTVKLLEELWSPHAILIPSGGTLGTGSFSNFRDISSEIDNVPSDARICEVEVFDAGGRVILSRYEVSRDGIVAGENEVIKRFTPR